MTYPQYYGPHYNKVAPDRTRCCESVHDRHGFHSYQCTRKRGHGPNGDYCKTHDPVARKAKSDAKFNTWKADLDNKATLENMRVEAIAIIGTIAAGHNDPSAICREFIERWKEANK